MPVKLDKESLNIEKQIRLLESLDSRSCNDARESLCMLVSHGKGIQNLVHYFCTSRSERAMEILHRVVDPHHNILLDTLKQLLAKEKKLSEVLVLLGQIIQTQPGWVNQVVKHPLFRHIIEFLRLITIDKEQRNPNTSKEKLTRKELVKDEVELEQCSIALREYFQALYGIFPIQFVSFLKHYFTEKNDKKKQCITQIILSLMNGVRLHPHLVFHTKEWEQSSQRYEDKTDAAFFLDQIRQITIGVIPVPVDFENEETSEPASPSCDGQSSKGQTFTFSAVENDSSASTGAWMDETADLLEMINTPEGSRPSSPMRRTPADSGSPIVLTSEAKIRRTSGEGMRQSRLSSFGTNTMLKRSERKSVIESTVIEIETGNEQGRRDSQGDSDLCDEAEDALDDLPTIDMKEIDRRKYYDSGPSAQPSPSPASTQGQTSPRQPAPPSEENRRPTVNEIVEEMKINVSSIRDAAKAARLAVQEKKKLAIDVDAKLLTATVRSRSASLKPLPGSQAFERGRTCTMDAGFLQSTADSDSGDITALDSTEGRSRFSVTSYFSKLNRQRFVSECPQRDELSMTEQIPLSGRARTLERTFSCPDLNRQAETALDGVPKMFDIPNRGYKLPDSPKSPHFYDNHPYFKKYQPLEMVYLHQLEERFAARQERKLDLYMTASKKYHSCLKSLTMADRLPGRIYDDLTLIIEGLPLDKQRDLLRARLQLVNQHLMYERSCRLLHALRNRRLFVQIMGENSLKAQLHSERRHNFIIREEVESLRDGLTAKRRDLIDLKKLHEKREVEMAAEYKRLRLEAYRKETQLNELQQNHSMVEKIAKESGLRLEKSMRRADDAEEKLKQKIDELAVIKERLEEFKRAHEENQLLREHISVLENCAERLRSPDVEEKQRQALYAELDKVTKGREAERLLKEELREKNNDLEQSLKAEQARAEKFVSDLARSARVLREQNEAAEQKFFSLQMVNEQYLQLITDLRVELETARDAEDAFKAAIKSHENVDIPPNLLPACLELPPSSNSALHLCVTNNMINIRRVSAAFSRSRLLYLMQRCSVSDVTQPSTSKQETLWDVIEKETQSLTRSEIIRFLKEKNVDYDMSTYCNFVRTTCTECGSKNSNHICPETGDMMCVACGHDVPFSEFHEYTKRISVRKSETTKDDEVKREEEKRIEEILRKMESPEEFDSDLHDQVSYLNLMSQFKENKKKDRLMRIRDDSAKLPQLMRRTQSVCRKSSYHNSTRSGADDGWINMDNVLILPDPDEVPFDSESEISFRADSELSYEPGPSYEEWHSNMQFSSDAPSPRGNADSGSASAPIPPDPNIRYLWNGSVDIGELDGIEQNDVLQLRCALGIERISIETLTRYNVRAHMDNYDQPAILYPRYKGLASRHRPPIGLKVIRKIGEKLEKENYPMPDESLDALAVYEATNGALALALPQGEQVELAVLPYLEDFEQVFLWFPLRHLEFAKEWANHLNGNRCYLIKCPDRPIELVRNHRNKDVKIQLSQNAVRVRDKGFRSMTDIREEVKADILFSSTRMQGFAQWKRFSALNKYLKGFRPGELTVVTGGTGFGKTTFLCEYALDLFTQGVRTLFCSFEMPEEKILKWMLIQFAGKPLHRVEYSSEIDKWYDKFERTKGPLVIMKTDEFMDKNISQIALAIRNQVVNSGIQHVVIDNLQFLVNQTTLANDSSSGFDRYHHQDRFIGLMRKLASEHQVHITMVVHPRKTESDTSLDVQHYGGSSQVTQEADNCLIIQRRRDEKDRGKFRKFLYIVKNRYGGLRVESDVLELIFQSATYSHQLIDHSRA